MMVTIRANLDTMQWVLTGFSMSQTLMMPLVGWMTDRFGLRHVFLACLSLTLLGSVGCGLAWSVDTPIGWRIVQGLGAGPLSALAAVIMFDAFPRWGGLKWGAWSTGAPRIDIDNANRTVYSTPYPRGRVLYSDQASHGLSFKTGGEGEAAHDRL